MNFFGLLIDYVSSMYIQLLHSTYLEFQRMEMLEIAIVEYIIRFEIICCREPFIRPLNNINSCISTQYLTEEFDFSPNRRKCIVDSISNNLIIVSVYLGIEKGQRRQDCRRASTNPLSTLKYKQKTHMFLHSFGLKLTIFRPCYMFST